MHAQELRSLKFKDLENEIAHSKDSLMIINYWATWCKPCIEELPYFEKVHADYSSQKVKVILVNLDFNSKVESVTIPFITRKNLKSNLYHLEDTDPNEWINKVDPSWSGAIPATAMYINGKKVFFIEGEMKEQQLIWEVEKLLEEKSKNELHEN